MVNKNLKLSKAILLFVIFVTTFFWACNPSVQISVMRPAEINLKDFSKITLGDIADQNGRVSKLTLDLSDELTAELFKTKLYEVIDRKNLAKIIEEQKLGQSGLVDETTAPELGKIIGSAVMLFGRVQDEKFQENTSQSDPYTSAYDNKTHIDYKRNGKYNLSINLSLIDVQTSKVLAVKNLNASVVRFTNAIDKPAPNIDKDEMIKSAISQISTDFMHMIAPYSVSVSAKFERSKNLPELDQAISMMKVGEWNDALKIIEKAVYKAGLDAKTKAKAYYNYAVMLTYNGQYEAAVDNFKEAMKLVPGKSKYEQGVINAKAEKEAAEKLKEQIRK